MTEPAGTKPASCIFTVDVEDWFHIPAEPELRISDWDQLPSHVSANFRVLLGILAEKKVRATCFFLGWVAERFPDLVQEAWSQGHEIACHSYAHRLVSDLTPKEFLADAVKAKRIIEEITGAPIWGYRAPCFSVTEQTPWFFEQLAAAGFRFDSSIFPAARRFGGFKGASGLPQEIATGHGPIAEFPISLARVLGRPMCFFGGGYLRLFPYPVIRNRARQILREGRPLIFYVHPREIDPSHPRMEMNALGRFKSYVNVDTTRAKIERILEDFSFTTFAGLISRSTGATTSQ